MNLEQFTFTQMLSGKTFETGRKIQLKLFQWAERQKIATQLQQTAALRFSSSLLAVTGKRDLQFSKFYYIYIALEPNIPGPEYEAII